ncbi:MAG: peptidoglycan DD-metalloendopeptidase family protein [Clostridiales bacterium]|nr:peptidoglycan DD-metalloendopeptidase family protein [Clostridiales bacterium]
MKQEPKSNSSFGGVVREKGNIINKAFVNEQGNIVNQSQISESQKQLVKDDSGLEAVIKSPVDSKNQIFGDNQTVSTQQQENPNSENNMQSDNKIGDSTLKNQSEQAKTQEYDISQQSYSSGYKNYANRIKFEAIQNQQIEQTEQETEPEYNDVINYGNEPVILGQNDVLPKQPQDTFSQQADYINYGIPKAENNTERQNETDTYENTDSYNNFRKSETQPAVSYDYTRPYVASAKQGYAEQVKDCHETADKGMVKNYDNTRSVINNTDNLPIVNKADNIANIREKPTDILSGLKDSDKLANEDKSGNKKKSVKQSQKPSKSSQGQPENQAERQNEKYSEKPPENGTVYNSSPKQGYSKLVKEYQREAVKDIIKEQSNRNIVREESAAPILQPSGSTEFVKISDYDTSIGVNEQNNNSADKSFTNNLKHKINHIGKKSAVDNQTKANDVDMPDVVLPENKISEIDETADIYNEPFTYRESEPSYTNSKVENVTSDIRKLSVDNDIIKTDYSDSVVKTAKELVNENGIAPVSNVKEERSDFSKTAHKKAVREYQKSVVKNNNNNFAEYKTDSKTEYIPENTEGNENIIVEPVDNNIIKSEKSYDNVIVKTQNSDLYKENAKSEVKVKTKAKTKENVEKKKFSGIIGFAGDTAKNAVVSEIKNTDDEGIKTVGAVVVAGRILTTGAVTAELSAKSKQAAQAKKSVELSKSSSSKSKAAASKTTKGDFRRLASKTAKQAEKAADFSFAVMPTGKTLMKDTIRRTGTITKNALNEGKTAVKNSIVNAIEVNADNSLAISAVDKGIKTVDTVKSTVKGTKAVVKTGKGTVKAVVSAPKNIYNGAAKLKAMSKKLRKVAQMKRSKQLQLVGKGLVNVGRMAVSAVVNLLGSIIAAVTSFLFPLLIIALVVFVIVAAVVSLIPSISLKADDYVLTATWEYISEKDADIEIEYKDKYNSFPLNEARYTLIEVNKYFSVNGSEVLSDWNRYRFERGSSFRPDITYSEINKTSYKTNIDAFLIYLDAKYEDYKLDDVKADIDNLYSEVMRVQYVDNEDSPSFKMVGETRYAVYNLNVNLHYEELKTYIQNNKDTLFTNAERQNYELLDEVGQYMTKIELSKPIETDDESIACQKRYGYYVDPDTNEKKFQSGIDITASPGTKVISPISGKIDAIDGDKIDIYSKSSKRIVSISNVTGITVSVGNTVKKGNALGTVDSSGYICLEYKIKKTLSEVNLNPSFYIDNLVYTSNATSSTLYDVAIDLDDYAISTELSGTARAVVEAALSMVGNTGYTNSCAKAVSTIYEMAGLGYHGGNGNDFSRANKLSITGGHVDYTQIPLGAYIGIKYGTGNAGYLYGHVAVYVGIIDGVPSVVQGGSDAITITSLDHYYEYFVTNNPNSAYGNDIGWNITSTNGSVSPLYFEGTGED